MDGNIEKVQSLTGKIKGLGIDKTLTKKGMCAEAEATGKALATKVNITDIVDELTSVAVDKPLSANQGRVLKKQIDEIDPHTAENVVYDNADSGVDANNVKVAIDKLSKAESINFDKNISGLNSDNVQGAIDELRDTIGYTVSKNYLPNPLKNSTVNGIDCDVSEKGIVTLNGTATLDTWFTLVNINTSPLTLEKGTHILNGCPKGGSEETYCLYTNLGTTDDSVQYDVGNGVSFTLDEPKNVGTSIRIKQGVTVNNLVFKPMISKEGGEYEPYVEDVQTQIDNSKINSSTTSLINTNLSASENAQTITINNYNNYNGLYIVFRPSGDMTNGEHFFVPKCLFGMAIPFTVDSSHNFDDVYTCRTHGYVKDGVINFNKLKCKGWTFMQVLVIGLK